ncbi:MAG: anaerobic ribonucleoside-triphosphate reductase, partial [Candidatus Marinamargulisbacteria bacterium]
DFHIHDLSMFSGYCAGWSLRRLIEEGFGGIKNKISSKPAKHLSTLVSQMVNFLGVMQNEWAGAQAFSSFDTYLAPFVRADNLSYAELKQHIQSFIFSINTPSRWGSQAPFTNITLDWIVPEDLKDIPAIVGGTLLETTYGDYQPEIDMVNKAFLEVMTEGDADGRGFAYPIPTYNITKDFEWETDNAKKLFEMAARYGTPYFQNFINSSLNPADVRSMCCRLQLDKRELKKRGGGLFGADEFTGSIGVVTINMARIGYLATSKSDYFSRLKNMMDLAKDSLEIKRTIITNLLESDLFPYTKRYLRHLNNHFSTIGINGMNESCLNFSGTSLSEKSAIAFTKEVLVFMREHLKDFQEETGQLYNLEATPAEATSYRLAKINQEKFPDIISSGESAPYYTNSSQLPVDGYEDIFEALELQDDIQTLYTGGTVFHGFLGEQLPNWKACSELVKTIATNFKLPYFTITPTYSICKNHGYLSGEQFTCPHCDTETEVYSRIVGYYRPVQNWNKGKKAEYALRQVFDPKSVKCAA